MPVSSYIICLWPGLPRLWHRGDWSALATAVAFGVGLNLVLVSSFVWPELFPSSFSALGWITVATAWSGAAFCGYRALPALREPPQVDDQGLFIQAQAEYLKCHWFEAETLLRKLVRHCRRDVDALLMLAMLYRHTRRYDEAAQHLDQLNRFDEAVKWRLEIEKERAMLKRLAASGTNKDDEGTEPGMNASNGGLVGVSQSNERKD